ncbi:MAG: hypothetical protein J7J07_07885, partial [Syntrophobacterales bacterium]|nr:hypothetical protein [Syntrophobacterales bacterium]
MDGGLPQHTRNENPDPENPVFRSRAQNNKAGKNGQAHKCDLWIKVKAQNTKSGDKKISSKHKQYTSNIKIGKLFCRGKNISDEIKIRTTTDRGSDFAKITVSLIVIYISLIYIVKYLSSFGNPYSSKISGRFLFSKTTLLFSKTTLFILKDHAFYSQRPRFYSQRPRFYSQRPRFLFS